LARIAGKPSFAIACQQILTIAVGSDPMRQRGGRRRNISSLGEAVVITLVDRLEWW
jgi:hypothetical protein